MSTREPQGSQEAPRVFMPRPLTVLPGDIAVSHESTPVGRRFHMDVSEEILVQVGQVAFVHAVEKLGESVAHRYRAEVDRAVRALLWDRSWAEPVIREAIQVSVREFVRDMMETSSMANELRREFGVPSPRSPGDPE